MYMKIPMFSQLSYVIGKNEEEKWESEAQIFPPILAIPVVKKSIPTHVHNSSSSESCSTQHLHCRAFRVMVLLFTPTRKIHKKMRSRNFRGEKKNDQKNLAVVLGNCVSESKPYRCSWWFRTGWRQPLSCWVVLEWALFIWGNLFFRKKRFVAWFDSSPSTQCFYATIALQTLKTVKNLQDNNYFIYIYFFNFHRVSFRSVLCTCKAARAPRHSNQNKKWNQNK